MTHNELARIVVDAALMIHRKLGPGLLESVYLAILEHELQILIKSHAEPRRRRDKKHSVLFVPGSKSQNVGKGPSPGLPGFAVSPLPFYL